MKRTSFEERGSKDWAEFEDILQQIESPRGQPTSDPERLPGLFRQACSDLSLAEHRVYGKSLTERLNSLVIRGYNLIYKPSKPVTEGILTFLGQTFPRAVRAHAHLFWLNMLLFWGGFLAMVISVQFDPIWVQSVLGQEQMQAMDMTWGNRSPTEAVRDEFESNFVMFCLYVYNNISIDFMTFAGGILFCLGTIFFSVFNGVHLGAATGYVHHACRPDTFYSFVAGHSSFELMALVISGTAGMLLGLSILKPGRRTRRQALVDAGRGSLPLILGAASMTFVAACIEGFWSAQPLEPIIKYSVGVFFWVVLIVYLVFAGRGGNPNPQDEH
ncbi:MAG: hypothetical protein CMP28_04110 [Roseibacillus sp.]|nr:hypothetical protein [Roseibacillus sp.]